MNTFSKVVLGSLLTASAAASQAQSIDIKVIGTITPAACTPTIAGGGVVDYGTISASTLNVTAYNVLAEKEVSFTIACDAPTKLGVKAIDNRSASVVPGITQAIVAGATDLYNYGLGTVSGAKVGGYMMRLKPGSFTGDGATVGTIGSLDNGTTWTPSGTGGIGQGAFMTSWGPVNGVGTLTPGAYRNLAGTLSVQAVLNKAEALPLSADVPLDGLATLELKYL